MKTFELLLSDLQLPSSKELIELVRHDSAFSAKTRYIKTQRDEFQSSNIPVEFGTWSFNSLETNFPVIQEACNRLREKLKMRVQCNAYYTPPFAQGLPVHYDLHDVFVLQVEGSKRWKVWPSFRNNVSVDTLLFDEKENLPNWTELQTPKDFVLDKNQTLYLVKGEPHVAITTEKASLHFSFGIYHD